MVVLAGIARGFTGFVAGLVNVSLLTFLSGPVEAIALSIILGFISSLVMLTKTYRSINWRETLPLSAAVMVTVPVTATLFLSADPSVVKPAIGLLILGCGVALLTGWRYKGPRNGGVSVLVGAISGSIQGFTGSGGPLVVFYFLASSDPAATQRANIAVMVLFVGLAQLPTMSIGGGIEPETWVRALILFPGTILGTWVGMRLFDLAPQRIYQLVAQWALIAIGVALILH